MSSAVECISSRALTASDVADPAALLLGLLSVTGIQFLFVGTAFAFLPGSVYTEVPGMVMIGLGPLALAYLIFAALANLFATGPE